MDIVEKIIRENCWKFDKGYPDLNNPKDKEFLFSIIESYLKENEDEPFQEFIKRTKIGDLPLDQQKRIYDISQNELKRKDKESLADINKIRKIIRNKGIDDKTADTAVGIFTDIIGRSGDDKVYDKTSIKNLANYLDNQLSYDDLGPSGDFFEKFENSGISKEKLQGLLKLDGIVQSTAVGPGELFLIFLLNDAEKAKKGDLFVVDSDGDGKADSGRVELGGKEVEVKAAEAALSPYSRGDTFDSLFRGSGSKSKFLDNPKSEKGEIRSKILDIYGPEVNDQVTDILYGTGNKFMKLARIANELPSEGRKEYTDYLKNTFKQDLYNKKNFRIDDIIDKNITSSGVDVNQFMIDVSKKFAQYYIDQEGIDDFLLLNKTTGKYLKLNPETLVDSIGLGNDALVKIGGFSDISPRLTLNPNNIVKNV